MWFDETIQETLAWLFFLIVTPRWTFYLLSQSCIPSKCTVYHIIDMANSNQKMKCKFLAEFPQCKILAGAKLRTFDLPAPIYFACRRSFLTGSAHFNGFSWLVSYTWQVLWGFTLQLAIQTYNQEKAGKLWKALIFFQGKYGKKGSYLASFCWRLRAVVFNYFLGHTLDQSHSFSSEFIFLLRWKKDNKHTQVFNYGLVIFLSLCISDMSQNSGVYYFLFFITLAIVMDTK